ncbi:MAG: hypothetical protein EA421_11105 [Gemmatimonadales bacterium]|nr:MAG: hypothetical protein EA421_11105 [Gemmatimonadales bacterium]
MPDIKRILQEIQARSIWRVLGVYALSSWLTLLAIQVLTTVAGLPSWFPDLALGFLLIGLPPVLALAWLRERPGAAEAAHGGHGSGDAGGTTDLAPPMASGGEGAPPGVGEESQRSRRPGLLPSPGLLALGLAGLILGGMALAWVFFGLPFGWSGEEGTPGPRVAVLPYHWAASPSMGVAAGWDPAGGPDGHTPPDGEETLEALALALHEDLLLRLATVDGITPFSPRSMVALGKSVYGESVQEEPGAGVARARDAGAQAILWVELGRAENGFHLSARLFNARGRERWSGTFQVEDPPSGIFQAQAELALQVLAFLGLPSDAGDHALLEGVPTQDMDALRLYARGRALRRDGDRDGSGDGHRDGSRDEEGLGTQVGEGTLGEAERLFLEAVERDPAFALAWSALSETRSLLFRTGTSRGDRGATTHLERSWTAADRALRLDPEDPLARLAVGHLLAWGDAIGGAQRALHEYRRAAGRLPGWAPVHQAMGEVARRTGDWNTALAAWERSVELEPGLARIRLELGFTHHLLRDYPRAIAHLEAAVATDPELEVARSILFQSRLSRWGDLDSARVALESVPDPESLPLTRFLAHFYGREFGAAGEVASGLASSPSPSSPSLQSGPVRLTAPCTVYTPARMLGTIRAFIGQVEGSRNELALARDELLSELSRGPHDPGTLAALGEVLALRGDGAEARHFAERAVRLLPVERDAVEGPACLAALARTRVLVGQTGEALDLLEWILAIPGPTSPGELRFDPTWDPLRSNPRFQALLGPNPGNR